MGKTFEVSDMPPLSREFHDDLRGLEHQFGKALSRCISSMDELFDPNAAFEYARTYAIEFYDLYYGFYSHYPAYKEHWCPASEAFALQRVIQCLSNYSVLSEFLNRDHRIERIRRTISDHAKAKPIPLVPSTLVSAYAASGVDIASGSPLLKMAAAAGIPTPAPAERLQTIDPSNSRKALRDAYRDAFPDVKIADIIWAAKQTRREWTRWITGQTKDGLKPDRTFKHVLTSGKSPEQIMGKPRPTKYTT
jgi:hypothetical protein